MMWLPSIARFFQPGEAVQKQIPDTALHTFLTSVLRLAPAGRRILILTEAERKEEVKHMLVTTRLPTVAWIGSCLSLLCQTCVVNEDARLQAEHRSSIWLASLREVQACIRSVEGEEASLMRLLFPDIFDLIVCYGQPPVSALPLWEQVLNYFTADRCSVYVTYPRLKAEASTPLPTLAAPRPKEVGTLTSGY